MRAPSRWVLLVAAAVALRCGGTRYVVVLVEDPEALTRVIGAAAASLWLGADPARLTQVPLAGKELPQSVGIEAESSLEQTIYVEAQTQKGVVLARGAATYTLASDGVTRVKVRLGVPWRWVASPYAAAELPAPLVSASAIAVNPENDDVYIADTEHHRIVHLAAAAPHLAVVIAGTGAPGYAGDGGVATQALLNAPRGVAVSAGEGALYIADTGNARIRRVELSSMVITTLAGSGAPEAYDEDGFADTAALREPTGLSLHEEAGERTLLVADTDNHIVRAIALTAEPKPRITTVAGVYAVRGVDLEDSTQEHAAVESYLNEPRAMVRCGDALYIADTGNHLVRRVDARGVMTRVLGDGVAASSGQGSPARLFPVDTPRGLACGRAGDVFVTSGEVLRVLLASEAGVVDGSGAVTSIELGAVAQPAGPCAAGLSLSGLALLRNDHLLTLSACTGELLDVSRASVWDGAN